MSTIKTSAAGIIASLGIAGAALIGAGVANAAPDPSITHQGPNVELHAAPVPSAYVGPTLATIHHHHRARG